MSENQITDIRKAIVDGMGSEMTLSVEETRLILHIRALGYGSMEVTVVGGRPSASIRITERIDYTKPLTLDRSKI